jgi:gamma-glutamyl-gamma-aminobutyrate hydrolase PuuD
MNVALGGSLATEIQERPGSLDHRAPVSEKQDERFAIRQAVTIKPGSCLAGVFGAGDIQVNRCIGRLSIARAELADGSRCRRRYVAVSVSSAPCRRRAMAS